MTATRLMSDSSSSLIGTGQDGICVQVSVASKVFPWRMKCVAITVAEGTLCYDPPMQELHTAMLSACTLDESSVNSGGREQYASWSPQQTHFAAVLVNATANMWYSLIQSDCHLSKVSYSDREGFEEKTEFIHALGISSYITCADKC